MATITLAPSQLLGAGVVPIIAQPGATPVDDDGNPLAGPYGTPRLDDFNRADGDPGADWVAPYYVGVPKPAISGNELVPGSPQGAMRQVAITAADCEVWGAANIGGILYARSTAQINTAGGATYFAYYLNNSLTIGKLIGSYLTGTTDLGTGYMTIVNPRHFALSCIGSTITGWIWDGSAWDSRVSATDTEITDAGYLGVLLPPADGPIDGCHIHVQEQLSVCLTLPQDRGRRLCRHCHKGGRQHPDVHRPRLLGDRRHRPIQSLDLR